MTFVFPVLLGGLALIGVPVLIHLIMRQKPKILPFPAFRFLLKRHKTNLRKLRLRHLLLLALRVFLIVAVCLALARPKLFSTGLNLSSDRPVAAILLFDTSPSMDYKTSDGLARFEEAKRRGLEILEQLPEGSRVAILDTAETVQTGRGDWLVSPPQARERINRLKVSHANAPVTARLEYAYRLFADLSRNKEDETGRMLPRFLCVFSDRTHGSWETSRLSNLQETSDHVPPALEGLQQARADIPPLADLLKELRQRIPPPAGQDYPEQALLDSLDQLRDRIPALTNEDLPPEQSLNDLLLASRRRGRELLTRLQGLGDKVPTGEKEYHEKLTASLRTVLRDLSGVHAVFVDVGVDSPVDLAITDLELPRHGSGVPRQLFGSDEKIVLRAQVQATGRDFDTMLLCQMPKKVYQQAVAVKAGQKEPVLFQIDAAELGLAPGAHQVEVRLKTNDQLVFNNARYVTFAIREPRRILVLTDKPANAGRFLDALNALESHGYKGEVQSVSEAINLDLSRYPAVYLFDVASPTDTLWGRLDDLVQKGIGVGIIPGGQEVSQDAYNKGPAQKLMPGKLKRIVQQDPKKAVTWNLGQESIYQHPFMKPFRQWKDDRSINFILAPRSHYYYWEVEGAKGMSSGLVNYTDEKNRPALLERLTDPQKGQGKLLLFTTTFDERKPAWNDYGESLNSFYIVVTGLATKYLAGELEEPNLNFQAGEAEPKVKLPPAARHRLYTLRGPDLIDPITAPDRQSELVLKQATVPGNYSVEGGGDGSPGQPIAAFSVNSPPAESNLERVAPAEIDALFGQDSVVPVDRRATIREAMQGHWNQPVELFPFLMLALLLVLAVENLLANKFYRKEAEETPLAA